MTPPRGSGHDAGNDVLDIGRGRPEGGRWRARVLLTCLGLAAATTIALQIAGHQAKPRAAAPAPPPAIRVTVIGHRLLGVTAAWQLFARGPDDLLRIEFAQGRIIRTYVPPLETASPAVALVVGAHEAVIKPADIVPGYVVPDDGQARLLTGPLAGGGPLIPGPSGSDAAWVVAGAPTSPALSLITLAGHRSGPVIRFPSGGPQEPNTAVSDGRGGVLVMANGYAVYDAGPGWDRLLPGTIIAVGRSSWLAVTCDPQYRHCRDEVIDAADGTTRILPGQAKAQPYDFSWPPTGVIAPDGTQAAVAESRPGVTPTVRLINLRTGAITDLGVRTGAPGGFQSPDGDQQSMAWSPDSHWLFVAAAGGHLVAISARTDRAEPIGVKLPAVDQVAVSPEP